MRQKTHIAEHVLIKKMSDIEYIAYLESSIRNIDRNINQFITLMDTAIFSKGTTDRPMEALQVYADNIQLLQGLEQKRLNNE